MSYIILLLSVTHSLSILKLMILFHRKSTVHVYKNRSILARTITGTPNKRVQYAKPTKFSIFQKYKLYVKLLHKHTHKLCCGNFVKKLSTITIYTRTHTTKQKYTQNIQNSTQKITLKTCVNPKK